MNLEDRVSELVIEVKVLQKICGLLMDSLSDSRLATKTADKALAMAQEALVVVTSTQQATGSSSYATPTEPEPYEHTKVMTGKIRIASPNAQSDEDLSKDMEGSSNGLDGNY